MQIYSMKVHLVSNSLVELLERRNRSKLFKEKADLTLEIASVYTDRDDHDLALEEYLKYLELWKTRDDKLQIALANRFIADCYIELGQHDKAITCTQTYLKLSIELNNNIEQQRAYVTLGRAYLNRSEIEKDGSAISGSLNSAARAFLNSIKLVEQLSTTNRDIGYKQLAEMRAVSLLNLGQVLRLQRDNMAACERFMQCTTLAQKHQLQKLLLRACYQLGETTLSAIPRHPFTPCKTSAITQLMQGAEMLKTLHCIKSNMLSQVVQSPIDNEAKDLLKATREMFGQVLLNVGEFRKAAKAYRLLKINYPSSSDAYTRMVHKSIRLSNLMEELNSVSTEFPTAPDDLVAVARAHERLGDTFGSLELNGPALRHYQFMLSHARLAYDQTACGAEDAQVAKLIDAALVSVAETYRALGDSGHCALTYQQEIDWVTAHPSPDGSTADLANSWFSLAKAQRACLPDNHAPRVSPMPALQAALQAAQQASAAPSQLHVEILTEMLDYLRCNKGDRQTILDTEKLLETAKQTQPHEEISQETEEDEEDRVVKTQEEDEFSDTELTDSIVEGLSSDSEVERCVGGNTQLLDEHRDRQRGKTSGKALCLKTNIKGETPLHVACINGDMNHVVKLIQVLGHPVNVTDGAGWLPLHEAAFHDRTDVAVYLLENGARLDDTGCPVDMSTPLFEAIHGGALTTALMLVQRGANLWHRNKQGECLPHLLDAWQPSRRAQSSFSNQRTLFDQLLVAIKDRLRGDYDRWCAMKRSTPPSESHERTSSSESPPLLNHKTTIKKKQLPSSKEASNNRSPCSWEHPNVSLTDSRHGRLSVVKSLRGRDWNELLVDLDEHGQGTPSKHSSSLKSSETPAMRAYQEAMQCLASSSSKSSQKRNSTSKARQVDLEVPQTKRKKGGGVIDVDDDGWLVPDEPKVSTSHRGPSAGIRGHIDSLGIRKQLNPETDDRPLPACSDDPLSTANVRGKPTSDTVKNHPIFTSTQKSTGSYQPISHDPTKSNPVESTSRGIPSQLGNFDTPIATGSKIAISTSPLASSVKVAFPDISVLVPIDDGSRSIAWLADEAYRRRHVLTAPAGQPTSQPAAKHSLSVRLSTRDGALLLPTDRLRSVLPSLLLNSPGSAVVELLAEISPEHVLAPSRGSATAASQPARGVVATSTNTTDCPPAYASSRCFASLLDRLRTAAGGAGTIDLSHWSLGDRDCVGLLGHLFSKVNPLSMTELNLSGNGLTDAFLVPPSPIFGGVVATSLLTVSPSPTRHLEHLVSLCLDMNLISLPGFVTFLESLVVVQTQVVRWVSGHHCLQVLSRFTFFPGIEHYCHDSPATSAPHHFSCPNHVLPNLKHLSVGHNPFWTGASAPTSDLATIRLASGWAGHLTHWTALVDYLTLRLPRLARLQLPDCGLDADPDPVAQARCPQGLTWSSSGRVDRPIDCVTNISSLRDLDLSWNPSICPRHLVSLFDSGGALSGLRCLRLRGCCGSSSIGTDSGCDYPTTLLPLLPLQHRRLGLAPFGRMMHLVSNEQGPSLQTETFPHVYGDEEEDLFCPVEDHHDAAAEQGHGDRLLNALAEVMSKDGSAFRLQTLDLGFCELTAACLDSLRRLLGYPGASLATILLDHNPELTSCCWDAEDRRGRVAGRELGNWPSVLMATAQQSSAVVSLTIDMPAVHVSDKALSSAMRAVEAKVLPDLSATPLQQLVLVGVDSFESPFAPATPCKSLTDQVGIENRQRLFTGLKQLFSSRFGSLATPPTSVGDRVRFGLSLN